MPKVNEQKHLGLSLDSKLSFERHVNEKIINAKKGIGIIKYLSKFLPIKMLDQMYKAMIRSHLDYCDTIYHVPASYGTWQGTNRSKLYEDLGWETLSDRRWCTRILQIYNIEKYKTPSYLRDKLPPHRRHLYRLNNTNTFQGARYNTARYKNNFFPDATSSWNNMI